MASHPNSFTQRFKGALAVFAICAVGSTGAGASHAEASQAAHPRDAGSTQLELGPAADALRVVSGNLDEAAREAAERMDRAEASGGREARGRELQSDEDD
ncbi:MAG: hypothetical protein ACRDMH_09550 [Solirubrobacterales bacterium]